MSAPRRRWPLFLQRRFRHWARRRQGVDGDSVQLHPRRVYILPTRSGLVFGLVFFTMLLGALNYSNNMGFVLAFVLTAVAVVTIHHCQRNLAGLQLSVSGCAPVFAGERIECTLNVINPGRERRWQIAAGPALERTPAVDIPAGGSAHLILGLETERRGRWLCPDIRVSTRHPLGLFESWVLFCPERELLVYPRPADKAWIPMAPAPLDNENPGEAARGSDEFMGLRPPLPGEPPSRIAWKALARTGQLLAKDYRGGTGSTWLEWTALPAVPPEEKLSLLTRLVIDAEAGAQSYGLRLPGLEVAPDIGSAHLHRCLAVLATFDTTSADAIGRAHA